MPAQKSNDDAKKDAILRAYIAQLTAPEQTALEIARQLLKTSFDLEKSNGFIKWRAKDK